MTNGIYLLLGSNLGDKNSNLRTARESINRRIGRLLQYSEIYETAAWGKEDQPSFFNQVIQIKSDLSPQKMLNEINRIENEMGRVRRIKWGERLIDIDILYYDQRIINEENLQIPHPGIPNRKFTLTPLVECWPNFKHPVLMRTNEELLASCTDPLEVKKVTRINS